MKLSIKIPQILEADDYHEFSYWESLFKSLGLKIKVEELPGEWFDSGYHAIVFHTKDKKYKKLIKDLKQNYKELEREYEN